MEHTDFFKKVRAIKAEEIKELCAAIKLHGGTYEWDIDNEEHPIIAVNLDGIIPSPADVRICKMQITNGILKLYGIEKEFGNEVKFQPDEAFAGHLSSIIDYMESPQNINHKGRNQV